jgi:hypothetical protein
VLYNFEDSVAMYRVLSMDIFAVPPRDVAALLNYSRKYGISLFESCEKSDLEPVNKVVSMIHKHLGLIKKETAGQAHYRVTAETFEKQMNYLLRGIKNNRFSSSS